MQQLRETFDAGLDEYIGEWTETLRNASDDEDVKPEEVVDAEEA